MENNLLIRLFLAPGTFVCRQIGLTPQEDGGIFRSFINMMFWTTLGICLYIAWIN